jgi:hypothetical protein
MLRTTRESQPSICRRWNMREAAERDDDRSAWADLGEFHSARTQDIVAAEDAFRRSIGRGAEGYVWSHLGRHLKDMPGRRNDAISSLSGRVLANPLGKRLWQSRHTVSLATDWSTAGLLMQCSHEHCGWHWPVSAGEPRRAFPSLPRGDPDWVLSLDVSVVGSRHH